MISSASSRGRCVLTQYTTKTHKRRHYYGHIHSGDTPCGRYQMRFINEKDRGYLLILLVFVNLELVLLKNLFVVIQGD